MADHDLVIRGGTVIDATGAIGRIADVAIKNGRIAAIGDIAYSAAREIDATGLAVCPGFIGNFRGVSVAFGSHRPVVASSS